MGLKEVLSALRLVELESGPAAARAKAPAATPARPRMEEVLAGVPEAAAIDPDALPEAPGDGELPIPAFPEVYRAAGIREPAHGFSALKVLAILEAPEFAALEAKAKAAALQGFLKMNPAGPVPIADVVQDAVRRDQALDAFEAFLRQKLGERGARADREDAALQAEIDELVRRNRQRIDENRQALDRERQRFERWLEAKRAEERRLAEAVAPFVDGNPIST
jgi:hypothetical protein